MTRIAGILVSVFSALPAFAAAFSCTGNDPEWSLALDGDAAAFHFPTKTEMELKLETLAEGLDWPRAFTLIGDRDTAVVLLEPQSCDGLAYRALVLTQRGTTPILLSGCCSGSE